MCNGYELLIEKEEMWARMLMEVLGDNGIPCAAKSVHGAGLVIRAGMRSGLRFMCLKNIFNKRPSL
jgi:hypothetical protein